MLNYWTMSGGLRHIIKKMDVDEFEGIKRLWPKLQAYLLYCKVMRKSSPQLLQCVRGHMCSLI